MNFDRLSQEVKDDPLGRGYSEMKDAQVAASLNAKNRSVHTGRKVTLWEIDEVLDSAPTEKQAWRRSNTPAIKEAWEDFVAGRNFAKSIKLDDPRLLAQITALGPSGANIISTTTINKILDIDLVTVSRAEEIGLPGDVHGEHVDRARRIGGLK